MTYYDEDDDNDLWLSYHLDYDSIRQIPIVGT